MHRDGKPQGGFYLDRRTVEDTAQNLGPSLRVDGELYPVRFNGI